MYTLGVLDHSHIGEGQTALETLQETTRLSQEAEKLGYSRFWVSEHHGSKALAHSSPEVLLAHLAASTERIRVGSGGVMLSHYSPYKVAENFRLLEALHPGRIDLGIGRAPGGMPLSTRALQSGIYGGIDQYPNQVSDLKGYLHDNLPLNHPFAKLTAAPILATAPEIWLLGSSDGSARIAAHQGLPFAYAQFFGMPGGEMAMQHYLNHFQPSDLYDQPKPLVCVMAICAEEEEEAHKLATSTALFFLQLEKGMELATFPSVETALHFPYTEDDEARILQRRHRCIIGTPQQVKEGIIAVSERYQTKEIMIASPIHNFEVRVRSYRLIAETFGL